MSNLGDVINRNIPLAALDVTHIGAVQIALVGKFFLRKPFCLS